MLLNASGAMPVFDLLTGPGAMWSCLGYTYNSLVIKIWHTLADN
jgi:hypothetical protein